MRAGRGGLPRAEGSVQRGQRRAGPPPVVPLMRTVLLWALLLGAALVVSACGTATSDADGASADPADPPATTAADDDPVGDPDDEVGDAEEDGAGDPADDPTADPAGDPAADPAAVPEAPVLSVIATVAPVADLVAAVGGERVAVVPLVPPGADSHTYEPRPSDVARLEAADAYLGIGLALNDAALRLAEAHLVPPAPVIRLGELALGEEDLVRDHHDHGHSHGDGGHSHADGGHSHGDGGHTHGDGGPGADGDGELGPNPHVWTSLRNAIALVDTIATVLGELDPEGAEVYRANAAAYQEQLAALDDVVRTATLTIPARNRTLLTYHDAWTYFARDYDLRFAAAVQPADYAEPSAAEVRAVIDLIRDLEVPVVFGSEVFPSGVLETIAAETGARYVGDLADDVLPGEPGSPEHTYLELMRRNAVLIVTALGGDASGLG